MQVNTLTPRQASEMLAQGARLIDIRDAQEYAREHVAGATLAPLSDWQKGMPLTPSPSGAVILCVSPECVRQQRGAACLPRGAGPGLCDGAGGPKQAGLSTVEDRRQPLPLMRQVQIAAGSLVLLGVILGYGVSAGFSCSPLLSAPVCCLPGSAAFAVWRVS